MFKELLTNPHKIEPGQLQKQARLQFPAVLAESHLRQRLPDSPIPATKNYAIIGVASYAPDELGLLDRVENAHALWDRQWQVAVFDVMEWQSPADAHKYLRQAQAPSQTPVLEMWLDGKLAESRMGLRPVHECLQASGLITGDVSGNEPRHILGVNVVRENTPQ